MNTVMGTHNNCQFGVHLLLDAYDCDKDVLEDSQALLELLKSVTEEMNMKMICEPQVVEVPPCGPKDPGGYSGFAMISESHISFHTFPKRGFVTVDVYTCKVETDMEKLTQLFSKLFITTNIDTQVINRGIKYPKTNIR